MNQIKIGKFITKMRKEKKLTQEQLAEKMGVSINAVSKWERGLSFPDVSLYKKLCEELEISIEELINGEKSTGEDSTEKAIIITVEEKENTKKKLNIVFISSIIIIVLSVIIVFLIYKNSKGDMEKYYERNYEMTFIARNTEAFFKYRYEGKFPDYYGGMYISDRSYNLIVQIVKEKLPEKGTRDYYYYDELFTVDSRIRIEYVKNSYNDLEKVYNEILDYLVLNTPPKNFNSVMIDVYKNKVMVNFSKITDEIIKEFNDKISNSDLIVFEVSNENMDAYVQCTNYPKELGTKIYEKQSELLINIEKVNRKLGTIPVSLSLYSDGTYELYTTYKSCKPGTICNSILIYTKSIKGTYKFDVEKILSKSTNMDDKSYSMDNMPEYEIYLGEKLMKKYDTLTFAVEKGKKNNYLDELLKELNIDLSLCAKPEYE
ncbi:MAG: helix-turn-helix transcriptional regulator [Bacilli bacterium]|nr:helix-turn-helix transcriptional regulator [Bacilli bacterium]